jgi:uncharacterized membrane protein YqjE
VLESLRRLLVQLVALLQVRLELLSTEVSAELQRILRVLAWGVAALLFGALALLLTALTVVIALWDESRVLASVVVTARLARSHPASAPAAGHARRTAP